MSLTAKLLGVIVPVFVATTFCLTVPFIILVADGVILGGALVAFFAGRAVPGLVSEPDLTGND